MAQQLSIIKSEPFPTPSGPGMLQSPTGQPGGNSVAIDIDGKHVLLPLDGDFRDDDAIRNAIDRYRDSGEHLGIFESLDAARAFSQTLTQPPPMNAQMGGQPMGGAPMGEQAPLSIMSSEPPPQETTPGGVMGPITAVGSGLQNLAAGAYEAQPIHPLQIGQTALDVAGPTGLAMYDAYTRAKKGEAIQPGRVAMEAASGPAGLAQKIGIAQGQLAQEAQAAFAEGDYVRGSRKFVEYLIPFLGPIISKAGDDMAKGEFMKAIGEAIGFSANLLPLRNSPTVANMAGGMAESPMGKTAPGPVLPPPPRGSMLQSEVNQPNFSAGQAPPPRWQQGPQQPQGVQMVPGGQRMPEAVSQAPAVPEMTASVAGEVSQWADQNKVPLPAGVRMGNAGVRGLQQWNARASVPAAHVEEGKQAQFASAMKDAGGRMLQQVAPGITPEAEIGGASGRDILSDLSSKYRSTANDAYDSFRSLEQDPKYKKTVNVQEQARAGGDSFPIQMPQSVQLPVSLKVAKRALAPILQRLSKQWPEARKAASPGYAALKNIVEGPDWMSASELDGNLSGLKAIARQQGGIAKAAVKEVEEALQIALDKADPEVREALQAGRDATRAKVALENVIKKMRDERQDPYRAITLDEIAALKRETPEALPVLARGWLQVMMNRAFAAPGRFDHAAALYSEWMRTNQKVKYELYGPERMKAITTFFRTAAEVARLENPSGTAAQAAHVMKWGHSLLTWNPLSAAGAATIEIGQYYAAHLLWDPKTAALMTKALKTPMKLPSAPAVAAEVVNAARAVGVPIQASGTARPLPLAADEQPQTQPAPTARVQ